MKQMRVLNCTKRQREAIFAIADEVGCPVDDDTRQHIDNEAYPHIYWDGEDICSAHMTDFAVSFSEFITELLKYEKPKVWVTKEAEEEVGFLSILRSYKHFIVPGNAKNVKCTYEVEE